MPPFVNFNGFCYVLNYSFNFLSLLVLSMSNSQGKIAFFCIYFSFTHYDNLFLFSLSLYNHFKLFLKFQPSVYLDSCLLNFRIFSDSPCLLGSPVYLALEGKLKSLNIVLYFQAANV